MRYRPFAATLAVAVAAVALLTAALSGGSAATTAAAPPSGLAAYSQCIRSHGVPSFPDPTRSQGIPKNKIPVGDAQLLAAFKDCQHLMPAAGLGPQTTATETRTRFANEISFADCLRAHGLANFPDPTPTGQLTHQMLSDANINLHQPAVQQAADACVSVTHGAITKADVTRFIAGQ
jgi:hypothetical protein